MIYVLKNYIFTTLQSGNLCSNTRFSYEVFSRYHIFLYSLRNWNSIKLIVFQFNNFSKEKQVFLIQETEKKLHLITLSSLGFIA